MTKEIWVFYKEINHNKWGHRIYYVSNWGRVKCNGEFFKCSIHNGYYYLCHRPLHRIVAELFLPNWDPNLEVDHINAIKTDNRAENLRMTTHRQNQNNPLTRQHLSKSVIQYTKENIFITEFKSIIEAEIQTKIAQSSITECCKQKRKSAGGYIWRYKNI